MAKLNISELEFIPVGKAKDLTGQTFNRLTVLGRAPSNKRYAKWWCECSCEEHNIVQVIGSHLISGETKSCGCYNKEIVGEIGKKTKKDLVGQKFGKLTVIEDDGTRDASHRSVKWKCQCECGNFIYVRTDQLTTGHTMSCGCADRSRGEKIIIELFKKNNIKYISEFSPKDFHFDDNPKSHPRFDFYLPDYNKIIEFDGRQHYQPAGGFFEGQFDFIKERDQIKEQYCKEKGYILQRIPYWDINKISLEYLGVQK